MTQANLLGVPLDLGAKNLGVDIGPDAFRHHHIIEKLRSSGIKVDDDGNVPVGDRHALTEGDPRLRYLDEIVRVNNEVAARVDATIRSGKRSVVVGGDHSINLGTMAGASVAVGGDIAMIYFDAHGDMNTDETTLSGNIHGMNVASLMGFGAPALKNVYGETTKLATENLLHIGGSDLDQGELDLIEREHLDAYMLFDILTKGLGPLIDRIDALAQRVPNIWVSLDLDSIDQIYAPGAGMPNAKGLSYREIATLAEYIGKTCNVIGIDVVEYNPLQDEQRKTAELGIELIAKFLGHNYSWYSNYMQHNTL